MEYKGEIIEDEHFETVKVNIASDFGTNVVSFDRWQLNQYVEFLDEKMEELEKQGVKFKNMRIETSGFSNEDPESGVVAESYSIDLVYEQCETEEEKKTRIAREKRIIDWASTLKL